MYQSLDATASVFAPFLALRRGDAQAARSISTSLVSTLPPHAFYLSLRDHHWAISFTISAALISSFLTVVASGLYSPVTVLSSRAVQMQQTSVVNLSHIDLSEGDNFAGETTKLMMFYNLSNPLWTYGNLMFPKLDALIPDSFLGSNTTYEGVSISMKLPALRPSLQCVMAPADNITIVSNVYYSGNMQLNVGGTLTNGNVSGVFSALEAVFPWSLGMSNATFAEKWGSATWITDYIVPNDTETSVPMTQVGFASTLVWEPDADGSISVIYSTGTEQTADIPIDPSAANFGFAAGFASGTKTNQMVNGTLPEGKTILAYHWDMRTDMVVALCYQILEEIQTDVTFNWPNMTTSQINAPVPDESTARIIMSNESSTPTWVMNTTGQSASAHWFGISLDQFFSALYENDSFVLHLDAWFTTLQNSTGEPLSELLGQANQAKLVNASSQLYARYAVQAMNANMRISGGQVGQNLPIYNGTLSVPVLRLRQNKASKIVLQVLLGVMAMCGAIAYSMLNTKELLRQSPCSIAGKMELLARSELCNSRKVIPEGAEWWDEKQRRQYGLFDGWFFGLGW